MLQKLSSAYPLFPPLLGEGNKPEFAVDTNLPAIRDQLYDLHFRDYALYELAAARERETITIIEPFRVPLCLRLSIHTTSPWSLALLYDYGASQLGSRSNINSAITGFIQTPCQPGQLRAFCPADDIVLIYSAARVQPGCSFNFRANTLYVYTYIHTGFGRRLPNREDWTRNCKP